MSETPPPPFTPEEPFYELEIDIEIDLELAEGTSPSRDGRPVYTKEERQALIDLDFTVQFIKNIAPLAHHDPRLRRYAAEAGVAFIDERRELVQRWISLFRGRGIDTTEDL